MKYAEAVLLSEKVRHETDVAIRVWQEKPYRFDDWRVTLRFANGWWTIICTAESLGRVVLELRDGSYSYGIR